MRNDYVVKDQKTSLRVTSTLIALVLCANTLEAQLGLPEFSNFTTGFESSEGYSIGSLQSDSIWDINSGSFPSIGSFGFGDGYGVDLDENEILSIDFTSASVQTVGWIDFYLKPAFGSLEDLPVNFPFGQAALTSFVKAGSDGRIYAFNGDGQGSGVWVDSGYTVTLNASSSANWVRMTYRLDYSTLSWDLFLNDQLQLIDLGFIDANTPPLSAFSIEGTSEGLTQFDEFEAGFLNPLYADADNDGIADSYESAQGLDTTLNDRNADTDLDSLLNIFEYMSGFEAGNPDSDGDGVHDGMEVQTGANPTVADAYDLEVIPYWVAFESMSLGNLQGQGHWQISGSGSVLVQSDAAYEGLQALKIEAAQGNQVKVRNTFDGSTNTHIWVDFWMQPVLYAEDTEMDLNEMEILGSSIFFFKEKGIVCVLDGDGKGSGEWNDFSYIANELDWTRLTVYKDYETQIYSLWINGIRVVSNQGFVYTQPYFDGIFFNHQGAEASYVDKLSVSFYKVTGLDTD